MNSLHNLGVKSAILALTEPYCEEFIPKSLMNNLPPVLTEFFDESLSKADLDDVLQACSTLDITFTEEQANNAERETREQAQSDTWFRLRAGRITASKMKAVCRTNPNKPSISLIKTLCYPEKFKFSSQATGWGCDH